METVDVYRITNTLDETTLDVLVARLESRGKHPRFSGNSTLAMIDRESNSPLAPVADC
jgi:hypothetical protein